MMIRVVLLSSVSLACATVARAQEVTAYVYDVHGRLTAVERSGSVNDGADTAYAYDDADNRTSRATTGASSLRAGAATDEADADDGPSTDDEDDGDGLGEDEPEA